MSENTEKTEFGMLFSFPDQSENFVHGFEAGMIWQEMADAEKFEIDRGFDAGLPIHTTNIELVVWIGKCSRLSLGNKGHRLA